MSIQKTNVRLANFLGSFHPRRNHHCAPPQQVYELRGYERLF